jgi:hypothetical protein
MHGMSVDYEVLMNAKKKGLIDRIRRHEEAIVKAREYL